MNAVVACRIAYVCRFTFDRPEFLLKLMITRLVLFENLFFIHWSGIHKLHVTTSYTFKTESNVLHICYHCRFFFYFPRLPTLS